MKISPILMLPFSLVPAFTLLLKMISVFVAIWKYTVDILENIFCMLYKGPQYRFTLEQVVLSLLLC